PMPCPRYVFLVPILWISDWLLAPAAGTVPTIKPTGSPASVRAINKIASGRSSSDSYALSDHGLRPHSTSIALISIRSPAWAVAVVNLSTRKHLDEWSLCFEGREAAPNHSPLFSKRSGQ